MFVAAWLVGACLAPAAALAHNKLPTGRYYCYYWSGMSFTYSTYDLKVKPDRKYAFVKGEKLIGSGGSFTHSSESDRVTFKSGYLHNKGFKGKHDFTKEDGHTVRLTKEMSDGSTFSYSCAD